MSHAQGARTRGRMPALFLGHGSPMNVVLDNDFTRSLRALGASLPRPRAVLVVSAHWLTRGTFVTCGKQPEQIYDFVGFPRELYEVVYPAPGSPETAARVGGAGAAFPVRCSEQRGLDHAAWAVLVHLVPAADIPVLELSLDVTRSERDHYRLARHLGQLRDEGVLIIGSGNIVHNLGEMTWDQQASYAWAERFDEAVKQCLLDRDHDRLVGYRTLLRDAERAAPTDDHYLPMLYAAALQREREELVFTHESIQHGSVSMRCFRIG